MNSPERLPSETHKPLTGYHVGAALAVPHLSWPFADSRHCAGRATTAGALSESTGGSQPSR